MNLWKCLWWKWMYFRLPKKHPEKVTRWKALENVGRGKKLQSLTPVSLMDSLTQISVYMSIMAGQKSQQRCPKFNRKSVILVLKRAFWANSTNWRYIWVAMSAMARCFKKCVEINRKSANLVWRGNFRGISGFHSWKNNCPCNQFRQQTQNWVNMSIITGHTTSLLDLFLKFNRKSVICVLLCARVWNDNSFQWIHLK